MDVRVKRVYEPPSASDGYRVLVDRLWPRGLSRDRARIDDWMRDLAPSDELRRWYGHRSERFDAFRERYLRELRGRRGELRELRRRGRTETVTLLFAAREAEHSNAAVLAEALRRGVPRT
jgi:uncharacterized protein YeaO (DUF488 family)